MNFMKNLKIKSKFRKDVIIIKDGKRTLEDFDDRDAQRIAKAIAYALSQQYPGVRFEMVAKEKDTSVPEKHEVSNVEPLY